MYSENIPLHTKIMKKQLSIALLIGLVGFTACNKGGGTPEEQLAALKKQQAETQSKITELEGQTKSGGAAAAPAAAPVPVTVQEVASQTFDHYLEVQGKVDFDQNVTVSPKVPGILTSVRVNRGDRVTKGQVLATIDASVLESSEAELRTGLDLARTVYEKQKRLWDQDEAGNINFGAGLGKWEKRRAEPDFCIGAEHFLHEVVKRLF